MKIAELFYSIQGEGMLAGVPSVFIRTSGCNLRCHWCDTPYTSWEPEGEPMELDGILDFVRRHSTGYTVVTGGEPMIAAGIGELSRRLKEHGEHITIETAGTVVAEVACDLMSLSPKLANSTPDEAVAGAWAGRHERLRYQPEVLRELMRRHDYQLKFVVVSQADLDEIRDIVRDVAAEPDKVVLMPEGREAAVLAERSLWLAEIAKREGYRLSPRLQILLYGNRRGV